MRKIRLGHVLTLHDHSSAKLECVKKFPEIFEIVGIVAESSQRKAEIENKHPYANIPFMSREEMLQKGVDAVLVEGFELDLIKEAQFWVDHGVHVHIDKPAGGNVEDLEKLLKTAKEKNIVVQIAYMYRYNAAYLDCLKKIENGELGEIYEVTAIMNTAHSKEKRAWLGNFDGGIMFFLGCHMVDIAYRVLGVPDAIHPFLKSTGFQGVTSIDHAKAIFEYSNGTASIEATSTEINGYGRRQIIICGSKGTYEIEPIENPTHAWFIPAEKTFTYKDNRQTEVDLPPYQPTCRYDDMMIDFCRFICGEAKNPYTYTYELELQKLLLASCGHTEVDWKNVTNI